MTTRKSFYVEISRARHRAELVTDDAKALREILEAATGERVSALEGIGAAAKKPLAEEKERGRGLEPAREPAARPLGKSQEAPTEMAREPKQKSVEMDLGL